MKQEKTTVLILGAGPAGLSTAVSLATAGVACVLVERQPADNTAVSTMPRAQRLNVRTVEILRQLGLETAVRELAETPDKRPTMIFTTAVSAPELTRFPLTHEQDEAEHSPVTHLYLTQPNLEKLLAERLDGLPNLTRYDEHEWVRVETVGEQVTAVIRPRYGGERLTIQADYIIVADGASHLTSELLGRETKRAGDLPHMMTIHFRAPELNGEPCERYWLFNKQLVGTLTPVAGQADEWVLMMPFIPPEQKLGTLSAADCTALIRTAVNDYQLTPDILNTAVWPMQAHILERFDLGQRIFFVGDAAHQFGLLGDLGLNMALQGAHNLAWKLRAVCAGWADPALLTTYDTEWRPVALLRLHNSYDHLQALFALFGLDTADLHQIQAWMNRGSTRILPHELQEHLPVLALRRQLDKLAVLGEDSERGERRRKGIVNRVQEAGDDWFQPWGLDLGYVYESGALLAENSPQPAGVNPLAEYVPSTWPGVRLPHVWLTRPGTDAPISTLDLVEPDRLLLLTSNPLWAETATAVAEQLGVPLKAVVVGEKGDLQDGSGRWSVVSGIGTAGAVLVRPDGHVAWRSLRLPDTAVAAQK
ncbi:MAG: FAD-dependent monooxygenase [Anaerolineales bacterium]|nr:FAD-dependent monooxygenase [Anaerolineales bacterium]